MVGLYNFQIIIYILLGIFEGYIFKNGVLEVYFVCEGDFLLSI